MQGATGPGRLGPMRRDDRTSSIRGPVCVRGGEASRGRRRRGLRSQRRPGDPPRLSGGGRRENRLNPPSARLILAASNGPAPGDVPGRDGFSSLS